MRPGIACVFSLLLSPSQVSFLGRCRLLPRLRVLPRIRGGAPWLCEEPATGALVPALPWVGAGSAVRPGPSGRSSLLVPEDFAVSTCCMREGGRGGGEAEEETVQQREEVV